MTSQPKPEHSREKLLAAQILVASSAEACRVMDRFSNWLLGGSGAVAALLVANLEGVRTSLAMGSLYRAFWLFAAAVAVTVAQKYIASFVGASAATYGLGRQIGEQNGACDFQLEVFLAELEAAYFYPDRWIVQWVARRTREGDLALLGRILSKSTEIQGLLIVLQVGLLLGSAGILVKGIVA